VVLRHSEKEADKNNNKHNNTSGRYTGRGSTKIEGTWQNPFRNNNNDIKFPPLSKSASKGGNNTNQGANVQFSREESIQKRPDMSMEAVMQIQLAEISQNMLNTLNKAQEQANNNLRRELEQIRTQIDEDKLQMLTKINKQDSVLHDLKVNFSAKLDAL